MKITEKRLKQILKEELAAIKERQSYTDDQLRQMALADPDFKINTDPSDDGMHRAAAAKLQIRKWAEKEGLVEPQGPSSATLKDRKVQAIRVQAMKLEKDGNWRGALNLLNKGIKEVGDIFGRPLVMLQKDLRAEYADQVMREETIEEIGGRERTPEEQKEYDDWHAKERARKPFDAFFPDGSGAKAAAVKPKPAKPMSKAEWDEIERKRKPVDLLFPENAIGLTEGMGETLVTAIREIIEAAKEEFTEMHEAGSAEYKEAMDILRQEVRQALGKDDIQEAAITLTEGEISNDRLDYLITLVLRLEQNLDSLSAIPDEDEERNEKRREIINDSRGMVLGLYEKLKMGRGWSPSTTKQDLKNRYRVNDPVNEDTNLKSEEEIVNGLVRHMMGREGSDHGARDVAREIIEVFGLQAVSLVVDKLDKDSGIKEGETKASADRGREEQNKAYRERTTGKKDTSIPMPGFDKKTLRKMMKQNR